MYKPFIRPLLFLFDPETIHHFTFGFIKKAFQLPFIRPFVRTLYRVESPKLERKLFGLTFPNPVGLAAGFDKDAKLIDELAEMGFGFIEIGTVTPKAQEGNPLPRLFRLPQDQAIINRMGFNNGGVDAVLKRLKSVKSNVIIGGNIGKNKTTPNEDAVRDYDIAFDALFDYVHYFVINISSPNTPNLRELQDKEPLRKLLSHIKAKNLSKSSPKPIFLKIAPDLTQEQLDDIIEIVLDTQIEGVIATNTTIDRSQLQTKQEDVQHIGAGGLSGKPLKDRSTEVIRYLHQKGKGKFVIIGVGGIMNENDALEKIKAGASLVQIYTGFIYEGPALVKRINEAILKNL